MKKNIKLYIILLLLIIVIGLTIFGIIYAIKNHNRSDILTIDNLIEKYTLSSDQLDAVVQPVNDLPLVYKELPKTTETINEIDYKTFKKIFQTDKKSILLLVKEGCSFCDKYLPVLENVLNELNIKIYKIDITKISKDNRKDIFNYIDFDGTPTTYIINSGKVTHTLTGSVDTETAKAFIDYFYIRNN